MANSRFVGLARLDSCGLAHKDCLMPASKGRPSSWPVAILNLKMESPIM